MQADSKDVKSAAMAVVTRLELVETALQLAKEKEIALIQKVEKKKEKEEEKVKEQELFVM